LQPPDRSLAIFRGGGIVKRRKRSRSPFAILAQARIANEILGVVTREQIFAGGEPPLCLGRDFAMQIDV
jgi:hypothetical protein